MTPMPPSDSNPINPNHELPESFHALVLLVDDQAFVANAIRLALDQQPDIDFHYCPDPCNAIALAEEIKPTVILLDLIMPQMDGLALVQLFRANPGTSETPIVVLSAKEEANTKSDAFAIGANDYLVKLPDPIELRARVRYHSRAHLNRIQRDEAFKALRASQQELVRKNTELHIINQDLEHALAEVDKLRGMLPICSYCKKIRDDKNYWHVIETYICEHSDVVFSHGLCPDCLEKIKNDWQ